MFPLIACRPLFPPQHPHSTLPIKYVFDFEELEYHYLVANRTEDAPSKAEEDDDDSANDDDVDIEVKSESKSDKEAVKPDSDIKPKSSTNRAILENPNIDNPYLRAATLPKRRQGSEQNIKKKAIVQEEKMKYFVYST